MALYKVRQTASFEAELLQCPFPFRRQINQAIFKLKSEPRPQSADLLGSESFVLSIHGWALLYHVDDEAETITIFGIFK